MLLALPLSLGSQVKLDKTVVLYVHVYSAKLSLTINKEIIIH